MNYKNKVFYYKDELKDEFSSAQITPKLIDGSYCYDNSRPARKISHLFWYKIIARPIAYVFLKIKFRHRIINRNILQNFSDTGFFLYGNHTNAIADALIPTMISYPTDTYVIVHPNNVSMPVLGKITPSLGALPLPGDRTAVKSFINALEYELDKRHCITIYPEAHIWPYYTKIRPFTDTSFRYPVQYGTPVFCFTNTYRKRKHSKKVNIVTYVDGPFYADSRLPAKEQKKELREKVYSTMTERSTNNNIELIKYIRSDE